MGLDYAWENSTGVRDFFNNLFIDDELAQAHARNADSLTAQVQRQYAEGLITPEEQGQLLSEISGSTVYDWQGSDPTREFGEGLKDGANNVINGTRNAIGGVVNAGFRLIPWQVWVLAIIALVIYIGIEWGIFKRLAGRIK